MEYQDKEIFPLTTQEGLSLKDQMFIDKFNYGQLAEYIEEGGELSERQKQIWQELNIKKREFWQKDS